QKNPQGRNAPEARLTIARLEAKSQADLVDRLGRMLADPQAARATRIIAVLSETKDPGMVRPLVNLMKTTNDVGVLIDGMYALEGVEDPEALRGFVELL